jgi:hypothetical protein
VRRRFPVFVFRHTFATRFRAKGVHEMDIMSLLGHTTLQMTSRYTHAMPENLRTAVNSLTKAPLPFRLKAAKSRSAPRSRHSRLERKGCERMASPKLLKTMAEGTGLEPASPCGRRFSRPLHYQLCDPSELLKTI